MNSILPLLPVRLYHGLSWRCNLLRFLPNGELSEGLSGRLKKVLFVGLLCGTPLLCCGSPNVLFIAADDLRMNLGCYGDALAVTPHLDRLAEEGAIFENAYCQFPSCNASRASLITGMRPDSISVWRLNTHFRKTSPEVVTLPEYLRERGYHTESIGKVLHNYNKIEDDAKSWSVPSRSGQINHFHDYALEESKRNGRKGIAAEQAEVSDEAYADGRIAADAVRTIERLAKQAKPFFLAVGFLKPHSPYNAPKKYWDLYDREEMRALASEERVEGAPDFAWFHFREIRTFTDVPDEGPIPEALSKQMRHGYYAATSYLDANVGKLLEALRKNGLEDNTLVVFWSDHGYHLGENGHWTKVTARELDARSPLLIRGPGVEPGRRKGIVEYIDLYPSVLEYCGMPKLDTLDGRSLNKMLREPNAKGKGFALTQVARPWPSGSIEKMGYSLRTETHRYTRWVDFNSRATVAEELYDLYPDPWERANLVESAGAGSPLEYARDRLNAVLQE